MMCGESANMAAAAVPCINNTQPPTQPHIISDKINDELLICKICFNQFSSGGHLPKLLSCSHTFCESCLNNHHTSTNCNRQETSNHPESILNNPKPTINHNELSCPMCRKATPLPGGGIEKLLNNFTVLSLMEIIEKSPTKEFSTLNITGESSTEIALNKSSSEGKKINKKKASSNMSLKNKVFGTDNFVGEICALCSKRFPESQLACGHCICTGCTSSLLKNSQYHKTDFESEMLCPQCLNEEKVNNSANNAVNNDRSCEEHPYMPDFIASFSNQIQCFKHCSNLSQNTTGNENNTKLESGSSGQPSAAIRLFRPPAYNPVYLDNPLYENTVELRALRKRCAKKDKKCLQEPQQKEMSRICIGTLPRCSTKETFCYPRTVRTYDIPYNPDGHSSCYELPNHIHESPSSIRRINSFRCPPVPPRRHCSAPGFLSLPRTRQKSAACSSQNYLKSTQSSPARSEIYLSPSILYGVSPPVPPPRRIYGSQYSTPMRCIKRFGKYSAVRMQTSSFHHPTKIAISEKGDIAVVDAQQMTVQLFTKAGDYLSMFKVMGVQGVSFFSIDRLAIATHRGVVIYTMAGECLQELSIGLMVNTAAFKFGFIVCSPKSVLIYRQSLILAKEIIKRKVKERTLFFKKKKETFDNIKDVCMTPEKQIVILDSGKGQVYIINDDLSTQTLIDPSKESCGSLRQPESICVDRSNNVYISDTGNQRLLKFSKTGAYIKCLLHCKASSTDRLVSPQGITTTSEGHLLVVICGDQTAEVRIYQHS